MARKLATGADFFTTQILYHAQELTYLLDEIHELALPVPETPPALLLTLCPVQSQRNIRFLHWLGVSLSPELEAWLTGDPEQVTERSLEHIERMWAEIYQHWLSHHSRVAIGISLAPIGQIPPLTTVQLARNLAAVADRPATYVTGTENML